MRSLGDAAEGGMRIWRLVLLPLVLFNRHWKLGAATGLLGEVVPKTKITTASIRPEVMMTTTSLEIAAEDSEDAAEEATGVAQPGAADCTHIVFRPSLRSSITLLIDVVLAAMVACVARHGAPYTREQVKEVFCHRACGSFVGMAWKQGITALTVAVFLGRLPAFSDPQEGSGSFAKTTITAIIVAILPYFLSVLLIAVIVEALRNCRGPDWLFGEKREIIVNAIGYIPAWLFKDVISSILVFVEAHICGLPICSFVSAVMIMVACLSLTFIMHACGSPEPGFLDTWRNLVQKSKALGVGYATNVALTSLTIGRVEEPSPLLETLYTIILTLAVLFLLPRLKAEEGKYEDWPARREFFSLSAASSILTVAWAVNSLIDVFFIWLKGQFPKHSNPCQAFYLRVMTRTTLVSFSGLVVASSATFCIVDPLHQEFINKVVGYNTGWAWMDVFNIITGPSQGSVAQGLLRLWLSILFMSAAIAMVGGYLLWLVEEGERKGARGIGTFAILFQTPWFLTAISGFGPTREVTADGSLRYISANSNKQDAQDEEDEGDRAME